MILRGCSHKFAVQILNGAVKIHCSGHLLSRFDVHIFKKAVIFGRELANLPVIAVKKTAYFYSNMAPKGEKDLVYPF